MGDFLPSVGFTGLVCGAVFTGFGEVVFDVFVVGGELGCFFKVEDAFARVSHAVVGGSEVVVNVGGVSSLLEELVVFFHCFGVLFFTIVFVGLFEEFLLLDARCLANARGNDEAGE